MTRLVGQRQELGLRDQGRTFGIRDHIGRFLGHEAKIHRHHYKPGLGGTGVDLQPFDAIVGEHRDALSFPEAEAQQRVGEPAGPPVPDREGHRALEVAGADAVGL